MEEHILCCSGKAGINYSFDNGKLINYQDNFSKIGDLPFSIYYDFETTIGSCIFYDAKMHVVSYCIIAAFHPDLNLPHIVIYRFYDQTKEELESSSHFLAVIEDNFFTFPENYNLKTFRQLQDAVLTVCNKTRETALAEMFNIELKFTCDCLRTWFDKNIKIDEFDDETKHEYRQNKISEKCCICDFSILSRAPNGWFDHVCKAEHLFLENIYDSKDMFQMGIIDYGIFFDKVKKVLDNLDDFCKSLEKENLDNINNGKDNKEIEEIVTK